jgi:hypothetical protein
MWIIGALITVAVIGIAWLIRARAISVGPKAEGAPSRAVTSELRDRLLKGAPADFSIEPDGRVWGVLMDTGYPEVVATLVALADGTASIYLSSGGGVIGGGPHENINAAARHLVQMANDFISQMSPASEFPLPGAGRTRFYVLTTEGVVSFEAAEEELGAGSHALSPLFFAGHEVITGLRMASERPGQ